MRAVLQGPLPLPDNDWTSVPSSLMLYTTKVIAPTTYSYLLPEAHVNKHEHVFASPLLEHVFAPPLLERRRPSTSQPGEEALFEYQPCPLWQHRIHTSERTPVEHELLSYLLPKAHVKHAISLVQHQVGYACGGAGLHADQVHHAARGGHSNLSTCWQRQHRAAAQGSSA